MGKLRVNEAVRYLIVPAVIGIVVGILTIGAPFLVTLILCVLADTLWFLTTES